LPVNKLVVLKSKSNGILPFPCIGSDADADPGPGVVCGTEGNESKNSLSNNGLCAADEVLEEVYELVDIHEVLLVSMFILVLVDSGEFVEKEDFRGGGVAGIVYGSSEGSWIVGI